MNLLKLTATAALVSLLAGCSTMDQLASVGEAPKLTAIADPTAQPGYRPVQHADARGGAGLLPAQLAVLERRHAASSRTSAPTRSATS